MIQGGIDPAPFQDLGSESGLDSGREVWVGMISRLSPVKGHEVFLRAAAKVAAKVTDVRFIISGESAQISHDDLRRIAESLGIGDRVKIEDRVEDVREVLRQIDIGVVASTGSEVMCRIALEMMASGLPVIGTDVNAVGESIIDGKTGVVIPPHDPDRLAKAMLQLIDDADLRKSMGRAGRDRVQRELSMVKMVEYYEDLYRKVLSMRSSEYIPVIGGIS
jgi:glycosyltransferase involved in cell wall biosynthesis